MLKREDALEINFVDSAARPEFKMRSSRGVGERRLYVGNDEKDCDDFFQLDKVEYFFTKKSDLIAYLDDAKEEFYNPSQDYNNVTGIMYINLISETRNIHKDTLKYKFRKTYDRSNRYYLVLTEGDKDYGCIRNIALPRITRFSFIRFVDDTTGKKYIYLRPQFFNSIRNDADPFPSHESVAQSIVEYSSGRQTRIRQAQYRKRLLELMPSCPFTNVADDRILVACHIKPYSKCTEEEKYDPHNGITMTPTYHLLFDLGFISFSNRGTLLISPFLSNRTRSNLNISPDNQYRLQNQSARYLSYHRDNIFCKLPTDFVIEDSTDGMGYVVSYNSSEN